MSTFERLFGSCALDLVVPDTGLEYPPQISTDDWLARLGSEKHERKQIFFDEQLHALLIVRINHPNPGLPAEPDQPPQELLAYLAHVQISLEGTYISSLPTTTEDPQHVTLHSAPLRGKMAGKVKDRKEPYHPSIFPPSTPNPTPSTAERDRKYVQSEGTLLVARIWGQNTSEEDLREEFFLLWSEAEQVWVAVYRLVLTVSFLRLPVADPLLCLTVAATLREKPLALNQPKHPLAVFFASIGSFPTGTSTPTPAAADGSQAVGLTEEELDGLEEVNLLSGLSGGPTFSKLGESSVFLPTTRLGSATRQKLFFLSPAIPPTPVIPSPSPLTAVRATHFTLRKSFRKTLRTVSGFRVRMRTVFVPYVLLPESHSGGDDFDEAQDERERREAGNEERTVVLCVEVENSGESGPGVGFAVEKVEVDIGGEGAKATLIGWGDGFPSGDAAMKMFPLFVESMAQYNLLYAVSFLRSPEEVDDFSLARDLSNGGKSAGRPAPELQRAVSINIHGKPYVERGDNQTDVEGDVSVSFSYPTHSFSSKWNCVLDLSTHQNQPEAPESQDPSDPTTAHPTALPEPASPFPLSTARTGITPPGGSNVNIDSGSFTSMTGNKRHTLPEGNPMTAPSLQILTSNIRHSSGTTFVPGSMSGRGRERERPSLPNTPTIAPFTTPSTPAQLPLNSTTYSPPQLDSGSSDPNKNFTFLSDQVPPTPAYPAYPSPSALPPTPDFQVPITSRPSGNLEPSVEIRRERAAGINGSEPQTPGPTLKGALGEQGTRPGDTEWNGKSIVVSIGLLPLAARPESREEMSALEPRKIYPLDTFTLDIFVFNRSTWTRRFEISCPERRRRRRPGAKEQKFSGVEYAFGQDGMTTGPPGILPLDNRVRIGPLRPSTCQSVRMEFLAMTPGVHSIDTLTLTDIESQFSMNLRSIMDVVVLERKE